MKIEISISTENGEITDTITVHLPDVPTVTHSLKSTIENGLDDAGYWECDGCGDYHSPLTGDPIELESHPADLFCDACAAERAE